MTVAMSQRQLRRANYVFLAVPMLAVVIGRSACCSSFVGILPQGASRHHLENARASTGVARHGFWRQVSDLWAHRTEEEREAAEQLRSMSSLARVEVRQQMKELHAARKQVEEASKTVMESMEILRNSRASAIDECEIDWRGAEDESEWEDELMDVVTPVFADATVAHEELADLRSALASLSDICQEARSSARHRGLAAQDTVMYLEEREKRHLTSLIQKAAHPVKMKNEQKMYARVRKEEAVALAELQQMTHDGGFHAPQDDTSFWDKLVGKGKPTSSGRSRCRAEISAATAEPALGISESPHY